MRASSTSRGHISGKSASPASTISSSLGKRRRLGLMGLGGIMTPAGWNVPVPAPVVVYSPGGCCIIGWGWWR